MSHRGLLRRLHGCRARRLEWLMSRLLQPLVASLALLGAGIPSAGWSAGESAPEGASAVRRVASLSPRAEKRELDAAEMLLRKRFKALPAGSQASIERAPQQLIIRIPAHELFESDSAQLRPQTLQVLPWSAVTDLLRRRHRLMARVNVYSDSIGGPIANHGLSELRALSLLTALHVASIRAGRVSSAGLGATAALAGNDTPEGREQNRRVEVVVGLPGSVP